MDIQSAGAQTQKRDRRLLTGTAWVLRRCLALLCCCGLGFAQGESGELRYIGHVPKLGGGFEATAIFSNHAGINKEIVLSGFTAEGDEILPWVYLTIPASATVLVPVSDLFETGVSHFYISGSRQVSVSLRVSADSQGRGSDSLLHESTVRDKRFRILPSIEASRENYWEGIAVTGLVLPGSILEVNTEIRIALMGVDQGVLETHVFQMPTPGKSLLVFKTVFPQIVGMKRETYFYDISSASDVGVTVLKGNTGELDVSTAYPISPLPLDGVRIGAPDDMGFPAYQWRDAVVDGDVLTVKVLPEIDCFWRLSLYWDGEYLGIPALPELFLDLGFSQDSQGFCLNFPNPLSREFVLDRLVGDSGLNFDLIAASVIKLHLRDREGQIFKTLEWHFRE